MKSSTPTRIVIALVFCAALTAIVVSNVAFAQEPAGQSGSGFSALVGRMPIRSSDKRFRPAAAALMHEATAQAAAGSQRLLVFERTILTDYINQTIFYIPSRAARGAQTRPLTASEALLLEELFSGNLSKARDAQINENGFDGSVTPRDLGTDAKGVFARAKARGTQKSQWYSQGSKELDKMAPGN